MSQILLPPPAQPEPKPLAPEESTSAVVVAEPRRPRYEPEPVKRPSRFWRAVKWPIRKLLKAIYLAGRAIRRHRIIALVVLAILLLGGGGYFAYHVTQRSGPVAIFGNPGTASQNGTSNTPFTIIISSSLPPLSPGVIDWLHAHKTYNGQELWDALSPALQASLKQQGITESTVQGQLNRQRQQGIAYDQFIYTGGYLAPNGTANYTVQVVISVNGQQSELTWYFVVDPNNQILAFQDLTLQGQP
jgi:hypothetical protein